MDRSWNTTTWTRVENKVTIREVGGYHWEWREVNDARRLSDWSFIMFLGKVSKTIWHWEKEPQPEWDNDMKWAEERTAVL